MENAEEINFITMLLPLAGIIFLIAIGVILMHQQFQKNLIRQQLAKEALKINHQKELLQTVVKTQEEERKRIARDLHDELGAALSIGKMQLMQLESEKTVDTNQITSIRELVETTLASTRRISHELMPLQLSQLGLKATLSSLLLKAEETGKLKTSIVFSEAIESLPWLLELGLYRIYSELINNTLKHAEAQQIDASIYIEKNTLYCRYADDGKGLPEQLLNNGLGLESLKVRVEVFDGIIEFGNQESGGFYANIRIPTIQ